MRQIEARVMTHQRTAEAAPCRRRRWFPILGLRLLLALASVLAVLQASTLAGRLDEVDVRSEVRDFKKTFERGKTGEERVAAVEALPDETGDERLAKALIEALENHLKVAHRLSKELDKAKEELAPYIKPKLLDSEWTKRGELEKALTEVAGRVAAEERVALVIVDKLVEQESDEVVEFLADYGLRNRSWRVRAEIVASLGRMRHRAALDTVVIATQDKDPRVRQVAVEQAAGMQGSDDIDRYLIERIEDEAWPVRAAAIAGLAKRKSDEAVGPLILRLGEEEGRLRDDCAKALETITGQTFSDNVLAWRDWWVENHLEELEARSKPSVRHGGVSFQTVETNSQAIMYVIDISDSMNEAAANAEVGEGGMANRDDVDRSKFDVMIKELIQTIGTLPSGTKFNMIVYNHEVKRWKDEMQPVSKKTKNEALEFLLEVEPEGGTNIFDSLALAIESAGFGAQDRYYAPLVDTIYFLSDGEPSAGRFTERKEMLTEIDRMNRFRRITIHAIGIGKLHDKEFMKRLADSHGGAYVQRL